MELTNTTPLEIAKQQAEYAISCIAPSHRTRKSRAKPTTFDKNYYKHTCAPPLINTFNPPQHQRAPHNNNNRQPFTPLQTQPRNSAASTGKKPRYPNEYNVSRDFRQQFNSLQLQSQAPEPVQYAFNNPHYSPSNNNNKRKQSTPSQTLPEKPSIFDMIKRKTSSHK
eukprot:102152_1